MHSLRRRWWLVIAVAGCFLAASGAPEIQAAGKKKETCKPGVDKNFTWQRIDINAARKAEKPILLYIYDPLDGKPSDAVKTVQEQIFANPGVKQAFADFTPVMQYMGVTSWPPAYTAPAKNGVALFIMTCDAKPVALFTHRNLPKAVKDAEGNEQYPLLQAAAAAALKANVKVQAAMRKNPPKEYVSPEELAARREVAAQPESVEEQKHAAAGLLDGADKPGEKAADAGKNPGADIGKEKEKKPPVDEVE